MDHYARNANYGFNNKGIPASNRQIVMSAKRAKQVSSSTAGNNKSAHCDTQKKELNRSFNTTQGENRSQNFAALHKLIYSANIANKRKLVQHIS